MVITTSIVFAMASAVLTWPPIEGLEREYQFSHQNEARVEVTIRDQDGNPEYRLECGNYLDDSNRDFYFSGDFECRLESLYSEETVSTLFTYNEPQSADWESRAVFYAGHFAGPCRSSPHGGKPRVFHLRNMEIILEISDEDLVFEEVQGRRSADFGSFRFRVKVSRDDDANRHISDDIGPDELPRWFHKPWMCLEESVASEIVER